MNEKEREVFLELKRLSEQERKSVVLTNTQNLAAIMGYSERKVRKTLGKLEKRGFISVKESDRIPSVGNRPLLEITLLVWNI